MGGTVPGVAVLRPYLRLPYVTPSGYFLYEIKRQNEPQFDNFALVVFSHRCNAQYLTQKLLSRAESVLLLPSWKMAMTWQSTTGPLLELTRIVANRW